MSNMQLIMRSWKEFLSNNHITEQEVIDMQSPHQDVAVYDDPDSRLLPNEKYDPEWIYKISTYDEGMSGGNVATPGFSITKRNGEQTQESIYFPTLAQIKSDSNFCRARKTGLGVAGTERDGMYRSNIKINGAYLHLEFDPQGFMVLKPIGRTQSGIDHGGGSHWDKHNILDKSKSKGGNCVYDRWEAMTGAHSGYGDNEKDDGIELNKKFKKEFRDRWSDSEWYYYSLHFVLKLLEDQRNYSWVVKYILQDLEESIHKDVQKYIEEDARKYIYMSRHHASNIGATQAERDSVHKEIIRKLKLELRHARQTIQFWNGIELE